MSISNETLMAYVDSELDAAARAEVEAAMRRDPEIEQRIAEYRGLRDRLKAAYEPALAEPVPARLLGILRTDNADGAAGADAGAGAGGTAAVRGAGRAPRELPQPRPLRLRWRYPATLAASVLVVICAAMFARQSSRPALIQNRGGALVAIGVLARDLSDRLAGDAGADEVRIGVSFLARSGEYCRTFSVTAQPASAGIACRAAQRWEIRDLAQAKELETTGAQGDYRTASSSLPPSIVTAVQARISGDPLDRDGEIRARESGWKAR
jgi:hypothetical protein